MSCCFIPTCYSSVAFAKNCFLILQEMAGNMNFKLSLVYFLLFWLSGNMNFKLNV